MTARRTLLLAPLACSWPMLSRAEDLPAIRVGTLRFGSVGWELDVMRHHRLDAAAGVRVEPVEFAASQATQVALQAGRVDVIVQDWLWVSRQRDAGADWTFSPTSAAVGAVVVPERSPVHGVGELRGRRLGIAGSPLDKSWLIVRAYAEARFGLDLDRAVEKTFGPPPLLLEQLRAGRLDAMLTYWPFAARAEADGMRQALSVDAALEGLGLPSGLPMLGWVFSAGWAGRQRTGVTGFLAASAEARAILGRSDAEWRRIAPLTGAGSEAELARLRAWYRSGIPGPARAGQERGAGRLYDILAATGGPALVGRAEHLAPGTFWRGDAASAG